MSWLLVVGTIVALALASAANAGPRHDRHVHDRAADATATAASMQAMPAAAHDELAEHGHRHSGNPLQDLLTVGHTHLGCGCAGFPMDMLVRFSIPYGDAVVPRWANRHAPERLPSNPFRPPIA